MTIRQLTSKDLSAFRAIWAEGLMTFPGAFLFGAEEVRAIPNEDVARGLDANMHFGAFGDDTRILGFISARRGGPRRLRHMADVGPLFVKPEAQGQGIGRALLEAVLKALQADGVLQAELVVDEENTRAQAMYLAAGFHQFGRRPRSVMIDGVARHDLLMIKALDGSDLA